MGPRAYRLSYLYAKVAPIDVVAEEQVFGGGRRAAHLEQLHQIVELAVDVAANWWIKTRNEDGIQSDTNDQQVKPTCDRRLDVDHRFLAAQQRGALLDDAHGGRLLDAALENEVLFEDLREGFAIAAQVEHLGDGEFVAGRKQDA